MDRRRDRSRERRDDRRDNRRDLQSASSAAEKGSRLRMDAERNRPRPLSPPRRKELDNVMKKARREGTDKSTFWNKKLLDAEEKDPNRWRHSGYKELYGERSRSPSRSKSRSRSPKRMLPKFVNRARSPIGPASRMRKSRSRSPIRSKPSRPRPASPPSKQNRRSPPGKRGGRSISLSPPPNKSRRSPPQKRAARSPSGSSESDSSCSDDACSVCSPKQTRRKAAARSRSRSFSVPRNRPAASKGVAAKSGPGSKSTATIGRKPPSKPMLPRVEAARATRDKGSPPRDPRTSVTATATGPTKTRKESASVDKSPVKRTAMLSNVKIEGQKKAPAAVVESDSDDSSSSSEASGTGAPKMTLSERFGKMAQWSVDRRDMDYLKNMKITKESDSTAFKVVIDGPEDEEVYRTAAPEFTDRRVGAGYFPETMHSAPVGLSSWDDVRVRYKYYKGRGYLRDLSMEDYIKWEEWWYKYQEWLETERYYEEWANGMRHHKRGGRYRRKHSP